MVVQITVDVRKVLKNKNEVAKYTIGGYISGRVDEAEEQSKVRHAVQ